jgi:hypothetical protein
MATFEYKGYRLDTNEQLCTVAVFHPNSSCVFNAEYRTTSLDEAMRFVDAYRDGVTWAILAAVEEHKTWVAT